MDCEPLSSADVRQIDGRTCMTSKSRMLKLTTVEREIGEGVRAAKLQLRFDRVVQRLAGDLKATLASARPEGQSVVITVTALGRAMGIENTAQEMIIH